MLDADAWQDNRNTCEWKTRGRGKREQGQNTTRAKGPEEPKRTGADGRSAYLAHLMALLHRPSIRSGREWLLPVLLSLPAKTMGSMPPSSSGSATYTDTKH